MKKILSLMMLLMAFTVNGFAQDTWTVAGSSAALNGTTDWAPGNAENDMTTLDGENYTLVVTGCTLEKGTTYQFKVVKNHSWAEAYPGSNETFTVDKTAIYTVTYSFNANTKAVGVSTLQTGDVGPISHTYTVAGSSADLFGETWNPALTANDMAETSTGVFTWTKSNVALDGDEIQFKVCVDHAWGTAYPAENQKINSTEVPAYTGSGNYNVTITFTESSKDITVSMVAVKTIDVGFINNMGWENVYVYTFDPSEQSGAWPGTKLTKKGTATVGIDPKEYDYYPYSFVATDPYPTQIIFNNGDTPGVEWSTKTGDLELFESQAYTGPYYVITGNTTGYGNWTPAASDGQMNDNGDGTYSLVQNLVQLDKDFEYKVAKMPFYGFNGAPIAWYPSSNQNLGIQVAGQYDVDFEFDPSKGDACVDGSSATKQTEKVVIGASGWATTVTNSPLDFTATAVEAYTATLSGTTVTLNKVNDAPAETGLVLKGATGTHYIPVIASSSEAQGNLGFSSTLTYTVNDSYKKCFGLTIKNEKAQFVKIKNAEVIPAQKAFLQVEPSTPANEFTVVFEDESGEATGIQTLNAERSMLNGEMYNVAGQKVNKSYKGLVISNGKKVMMK